MKELEMQLVIETNISKTSVHFEKVTRAESKDISKSVKITRLEKQFRSTYVDYNSLTRLCSREQRM